MNKYTQIDICNNNTKNLLSEEIYEAFNKFIFSNDIKLIGKLLHRFHFFEQTRHLPGDIVEIGVFKGSGVATFVKFLEIFIPNSNKKVIGFDIFDTGEGSFILKTRDTEIDKNSMEAVYSKIDANELSIEAVEARLLGISNNVQNKIKLIKGDVQETLPIFLEENPGFRASLIYIDVDIERPTYHALINLWDRLLPGGVILFDEYEYHLFSESVGVDKFLKEKNLKYNVITTDWFAPTAYMRKEA
jgi:hypothetical protein